MPSTLDRAGYFRAKPYAWELVESTTTASVGVRLHYAVTHELDEQTGEWKYVPEHPLTTVEGTVYIKGRDGTPNERNVRDLYYVLKWNLDPTVFSDLTRWRPPACEITVERDDFYPDRPRYRVAWIHELGSTSRGQGRAIGARLAKEHGADYQRIIAEDAAKRGLPAPEAASPFLPSDEAPTGDQIPF